MAGFNAQDATTGLDAVATVRSLVEACVIPPQGVPVPEDAVGVYDSPCLDLARIHRLACERGLAVVVAHICETRATNEWQPLIQAHPGCNGSVAFAEEVVAMQGGGVGADQRGPPGTSRSGPLNGKNHPTSFEHRAGAGSPGLRQSRRHSTPQSATTTSTGLAATDSHVSGHTSHVTDSRASGHMSHMSGHTSHMSGHTSHMAGHTSFASALSRSSPGLTNGVSYALPHATPSTAAAGVVIFNQGLSKSSPLRRVLSQDGDEEADLAAGAPRFKSSPNVSPGHSPQHIQHGHPRPGVDRSDSMSRFKQHAPVDRRHTTLPVTTPGLLVPMAGRNRRASAGNRLMAGSADSRPRVSMANLLAHLSEQPAPSRAAVEDGTGQGERPSSTGVRDLKKGISKVRFSMPQIPRQPGSQSDTVEGDHDILHAHPSRDSLASSRGGSGHMGRHGSPPTSQDHGAGPWAKPPAGRNRSRRNSTRYTSTHIMPARAPNAGMVFMDASWGGAGNTSEFLGGGADYDMMGSTRHSHGEMLLPSVHTTPVVARLADLMHPNADVLHATGVLTTGGPSMTRLRSISRVSREIANGESAMPDLGQHGVQGTSTGVQGTSTGVQGVQGVQSGGSSPKAARARRASMLQIGHSPPSTAAQRARRNSYRDARQSHEQSGRQQQQQQQQHLFPRSSPQFPGQLQQQLVDLISLQDPEQPQDPPSSPQATKAAPLFVPPRPPSASWHQVPVGSDLNTLTAKLQMLKPSPSGAYYRSRSRQGPIASLQGMPETEPVLAVRRSRAQLSFGATEVIRVSPGGRLYDQENEEQEEEEEEAGACWLRALYVSPPAHLVGLPDLEASQQFLETRVAQDPSLMLTLDELLRHHAKNTEAPSAISYLIPHSAPPGFIPAQIVVAPVLGQLVDGTGQAALMVAPIVIFLLGSAIDTAACRPSRPGIASAKSTFARRATTGTFTSLRRRLSSLGQSMHLGSAQGDHSDHGPSLNQTQGTAPVSGESPGGREGVPKHRFSLAAVFRKMLLCVQPPRELDLATASKNSPLSAEESRPPVVPLPAIISQVGSLPDTQLSLPARASGITSEAPTPTVLTSPFLSRLLPYNSSNARTFHSHSSAAMLGGGGTDPGYPQSSPALATGSLPMLQLGSGASVAQAATQAAQHMALQLQLLHLAMAHTSCCIMVLTLQGQVLYQNGRSVDYHGLLVGRTPGTAADISDAEHLLHRIFRHDLQALNAMWQATGMNLLWNGLVRMPMDPRLTSPYPPPEASILNATGSRTLTTESERAQDLHSLQDTGLSAEWATVRAAGGRSQSQGAVNSGSAPADTAAGILASAGVDMDSVPAYGLLARMGSIPALPKPVKTHTWRALRPSVSGGHKYEEPHATPRAPMGPMGTSASAVLPSAHALGLLGDPGPEVPIKRSSLKRTSLNKSRLNKSTSMDQDRLNHSSGKAITFKQGEPTAAVPTFPLALRDVGPNSSNAVPGMALVPEVIGSLPPEEVRGWPQFSQKSRQVSNSGPIDYRATNKSGPTSQVAVTQGVLTISGAPAEPGGSATRLASPYTSGGSFVRGVQLGPGDSGAQLPSSRFAHAAMGDLQDTEVSGNLLMIARDASKEEWLDADTQEIQTILGPPQDPARGPDSMPVPVQPGQPKGRASTAPSPVFLSKSRTLGGRPSRDNQSLPGMRTEASAFASAYLVPHGSSSFTSPTVPSPLARSVLLHHQSVMASLPSGLDKASSSPGVQAQAGSPLHISVSGAASGRGSPYADTPPSYPSTPVSVGNHLTPAPSVNTPSKKQGMRLLRPPAIASHVSQALVQEGEALAASSRALKMLSSGKHLGGNNNNNQKPGPNSLPGNEAVTARTPSALLRRKTESLGSAGQVAGGDRSSASPGGVRPKAPEQRSILSDKLPKIALRLADDERVWHSGSGSTAHGSTPSGSPFARISTGTMDASRSPTTWLGQGVSGSSLLSRQQTPPCLPQGTEIGLGSPGDDALIMSFHPEIEPSTNNSSAAATPAALAGSLQHHGSMIDDVAHQEMSFKMPNGNSQIMASVFSNALPRDPLDVSAQQLGDLTLSKQEPSSDSELHDTVPAMDGTWQHRGNSNNQAYLPTGLVLGGASGGTESSGGQDRPSDVSGLDRLSGLLPGRPPHVPPVQQHLVNENESRANTDLAPTQSTNPFCWHDVEAHRVRHALPGSGLVDQELLVLVQHDVTEHVNQRLEVQKILDVEHQLLEEIFPHHVLQAMALQQAQLKQAMGSQQTAGTGAYSPFSSLSVVPDHDPHLLSQGGGSSPWRGVGRVTGPASELDTMERGPGSAREHTPPAHGQRISGRLSQEPLGLGMSMPVPPAMAGLDGMEGMARDHPHVTVLFADIKSFTSMCNSTPPALVMAFLNRLFTAFDHLVEVHGVYKVETIGDCYMCAGGLLQRDADGVNRVTSCIDPDHAVKVFNLARDMLHVARSHVLPGPTGGAVELRVGIHSGPCMSGVVGRKMPRFCLFGDTINTSSRMESTGVPGCIHVSEATWDLLPHTFPQPSDAGQNSGSHANSETGLAQRDVAGPAAIDPRWKCTGGVDAKGKGVMQTWLWREQGHSS